jgi:hypothetical protein
MDNVDNSRYQLLFVWFHAARSGHLELRAGSSTEVVPTISIVQKDMRMHLVKGCQLYPKASAYLIQDRIAVEVYYETRFVS